MADEQQLQRTTNDAGIPRWKLVLWAIIAVYAVAFLLLNSSKQEVSFVFFSVNTRLIWLILLSMALGAVLASILPRWWRSRRRE
ncbi:MAG TPA: LapA family protein [Gaiella sp.]|nr:LapA family protein [Gaiella sp.]